MKNPADLAVRYGGEEVAVILPNTDTKGTVHFADEICTRFGAINFSHPSTKLNPSVLVEEWRRVDTAILDRHMNLALAIALALPK